MAFPKKSMRKISVDNCDYYWRVKGDDMIIILYVSIDIENAGQLLFATFDYHQDQQLRSDKSIRLSNQFVVTPYTVRQVILYALSQGWKPRQKRERFNLFFVDQHIDLRLNQNKEDCIKAQHRE